MAVDHDTQMTDWSKKMRKRTASIALAGLLALAACSGTSGDTVPDTLSDTTTAGASDGTDATSDALAAVAAFQEDIQALSDAIAESDSAEELRSAWDTLNAELTASVESVREDGSIAREEIEASLDTFEQELDEIEVNEDVRTAWEELRTNLEQLMAN
jgi:chromosome segregation ATPase